MSGSAIKLTSPFCNHYQDKAYEASQKYKEGKFILERQLVLEMSPTS